MKASPWLDEVNPLRQRPRCTDCSFVLRADELAEHMTMCIDCAKVAKVL